jgi:hypothetical protein
MELKFDAGTPAGQGRAVGLDGMHGREHAALARAKHDRPHPSAEPERPAVVVERASADPDPGVYSARPRPGADPGRDDSRWTTHNIGTLIQLGADGQPSTTLLGDGASLEINAHVGTLVRLGGASGGASEGGSVAVDEHIDKHVRLVGGGGTTILAPGSVFMVGDRQLGTLVQLGGGGTTILGDGASMKVNQHIDTLVQLGGGGTTILGDGASLKVNQHIGTLIQLGGGGTTILGDGASMKVNQHIDTLVQLGGGGTTILGENASLKINQHLGTVVQFGGGTTIPAAPRMAPPELAAPPETATIDPAQSKRAAARAALEAHTRANPHRRHAPAEQAEPRSLLPAHIDQRWLLLRFVYEWAKRGAHGKDGDAGPPGLSLASNDK